MHDALVKCEREIKVIVDLEHDREQREEDEEHDQINESPTREIGVRNLLPSHVVKTDRVSYDKKSRMHIKAKY